MQQEGVIDKVSNGLGTQIVCFSYSICLWLIIRLLEKAMVFLCLFFSTCEEGQLLSDLSYYYYFCLECCKAKTQSINEKNSKDNK